MTNPSHIPDQAADDWGRPLLERQIAELGRLADMGMGIASDIQGQVRAAAEAGELAACERGAIDFARVARAVRLTFMLQAKLIGDLQARDRGLVEPAATPAEPYQPIRIERIFVDPPESQRLEAERTERFLRERAERLDREAGILARPVNEVIATIRQDLGLDPDEPDPVDEARVKEEMASDYPPASPVAPTSKSCLKGQAASP